MGKGGKEGEERETGRGKEEEEEEEEEKEERRLILPPSRRALRSHSWAF